MNQILPELPAHSQIGTQWSYVSTTGFDSIHYFKCCRYKTTCFPLRKVWHPRPHLAQLIATIFLSFLYFFVGLSAFQAFATNLFPLHLLLVLQFALLWPYAWCQNVREAIAHSKIASSLSLMQSLLGHNTVQPCWPSRCRSCVDQHALCKMMQITHRKIMILVT